MMNFRFIYSVKSAIIIISVLTITLGLSTFINQGREPGFYIEKYSYFGKVLYYTGFTNYTRSPLFIALASLFFINLFLCTVKRVFREVTGKIPRRFGPDIIHLGLLLLIVGGGVNISTSQKGSILLKAGEKVEFGEYILELNDFRFLKYNNGQPKDWISTIVIRDREDKLLKSGELEVNSPMRFGGYSIFQSSYNEIHNVNLKSDSDQNSYNFRTGFELVQDEKIYVLAHVDPGLSGTFTVTDSYGAKRILKVHKEDFIGRFRLIDSNIELYSGLLIKREPGYRFIYFSLILLLTGFIITYIQKIGAGRV